MTYGLNFPSVPLPYFYQANKLLGGSQPHSIQPPSNAPSINSSPFSRTPHREEDLDNNGSDEQSLASSPQEKQLRRDSSGHRVLVNSCNNNNKAAEEDVEVD